MIFEKIKKSFKDAVSEHVISVIMFLIATIVWAVSYDISSKSTVYEVLTVIYVTLMGTTLGVLLCEAIYLYNGKAKYKKRFVLFGIITFLSFVISLQFSLISNVKNIRLGMGDNYRYADGLSTNIFICYLVTATSLILLYFYKRSGESFETYTAKAFCGLMKAELVYGIIALGVLLIILAFDALIYDTGEFDVIPRAEILILGLVEFPCALIGLSKTEGNISKFGKIVLNYVFTGLLMAAFVIIYVYIIKILFTWKFPGNEVFSILTALFAFGVFIWTMAQGACSENLQKAYKIMPFLFVPFIVLQIMCLYMRVKDYGFTFSRYMGLAVIVFEILYFGLYLVCFLKKEKAMSLVLFLAIAMAFIILFVPGLNVYNVVTMSQKGKIVRYLQSGDNATEAQKHDAYEAYKTIRDEGGITGNRFLTKNISEEELSVISDNQSTYSSDRFYVNVYNNLDEIDVEGGKTLSIIYTSLDRDGNDAAFDISNIALTTRDTENISGTVDINDLVSTLIDNDNKDRDISISEKELEQPITTKDGGKLIITYIHISGFRDDPMDIRDIEIEGYLLK